MFFYDDDSDTPQKCRDRRRRRIELRKGVSALTVSEGSSAGGVGSVGAEAVPEFGVMSLAGKRRDMEDAVSVQIDLCSPEICRRLPVHYFAVFDGHGGPQVAAMCKEKMHLILKEEVGRVKSTRDRNLVEGVNSSEEDEEVAGWWKTVFLRSFKRMDEVALTNIVSGKSELMMTGSTAVVALLTPRHIVVANCGDSRAVLVRGGKLLPLSYDHKPDRPDELKRIEAAGGRVINMKGTRVEGILAMSRSIGDKLLKAYVTSEAEVSITRRNEEEDECLIIASDGVWDVISSELACEIAHTGLKQAKAEEERSGAAADSPCILVAALLTRLALGRESCDNISTIVVDLTKKLE